MSDDSVHEAAERLFAMPTPLDKDGRCWFCGGGLGHGPHGHRPTCAWTRRDNILAALERAAWGNVTADEVGRRISLWRCPCGVMLGLVLNGRLYLPAGRVAHEVETLDLYVPCDACGRVAAWSKEPPPPAR